MKKFLFCFFFLFLFFFGVEKALAISEFDSDFVVTYKVSDNGITTVENKITITNVFTDLYATSYSITLDSIKATNVKAYGQNGSLYEVKLTENESQTVIQVVFPDKVVGKGNSRVFFVEYQESSFAVRTGEVWEISIPRLADSQLFGSYLTVLRVPEKFGQEAYISPKPQTSSFENGYLVYTFSKEAVSKTGVVAGFGQFQVFSFNINYHLENPLAKNASVEIAIPPDNAFQKMYYQEINARPSDIKVDLDGNWIATYNLKPRERVDVVTSGKVQIFSNYRPFPRPSSESLNMSLQESSYWQTNDPTIQKLASELKTPRAIYDYVANTLKYDYSRVRPNVERRGAIGALNDPTTSICMEFTDLFIAIARAAGIPAREVNGFAYTENPEIQPLSLVNDVLHAWPEYYDANKGVWVPIDPTWASTTGGVDYFNKLDLRHFAFVMHGADATKPYPPGSYKLGANPQKDVFVSFGSLDKENQTNIEVEAKLESWIPLVSNRLNLLIKNPGPSAIYSLQPEIYFDQERQITQSTIDVLLPFQTYKTFIEVPFSFLGTKTPSVVSVIVDSSRVDVPTDKSHVLIYNLLFISFVFLIIIFSILIRIKKINFDKITNLWKSLKKTS